VSVNRTAPLSKAFCYLKLSEKPAGTHLLEQAVKTTESNEI
jgi:hypothetical protein